MSQMSQRINSPISTPELERRWALVRKAMEEWEIDVLLMQNNNDHMGGYTKYFTDVPASNGYPDTVVFPADGLMTVVKQGPFGLEKEIDPSGSDGFNRGVGQIMTTPSYESAPYTKNYDPELVCRVLGDYAGGTIGLVGTYQMSFALVEYIKSEIPNTKFIEASEMVDRVKIIKSTEELELIRGTASQQDSQMTAVIEKIEPGMRDSDVAAIAQFEGNLLGSEQGVYLCQSYTFGEPTEIGPRHIQDRVINEGDIFNMLVESNGPGGYFTEIGRTIVVGDATDNVIETLESELAFTLEAQRFTLNMLRPGAKCSEIWEAFNQFMTENSKQEEGRLYCHGQGYDMVERPLVRFDETINISENMNIVCHPGYKTDSVFSWICDNYIVGENGVRESIHKLPQKIFRSGEVSLY